MYYEKVYFTTCINDDCVVLYGAEKRQRFDEEGRRLFL